MTTETTSWLALVMNGGAIVVWLLYMIQGKLYPKEAVDGIRADAELRIAESEKRVADLQVQRDKLIADRERMLELVIGYKITAKDAIEHVPEPGNRRK